MAQSQLQLQNWHLKLTSLTNSFVLQTTKFFKHCRKVERQFSKTSRNLQDEKKRLAERESQINRIVASIESFLQIDIPIDELYTAVPEPGSDVDPFLSALTRRLSLGFDLDQIQQSQNQNHHENQFTNEEKNLVLLLQKENEEKSSEINSLLGQIEQSDAREKRLHRLAEKFTALATDFEKILHSSANSLSESDSCSSEIDIEQNQEEIETETEQQDEDDDDEENYENAEKSWNDLMTSIEQATHALQNYCDYRRNPVEIFQRNYVHFQETSFCTPFNEFLHLVESEFIRLWKNEDRREIYENVRKMEVGSQTETAADQNNINKGRQNEAGKEEKPISRTNDFLMQEKHLVENKLAHLSKLENSLQLRECELRLQETEFKRRVSEFAREKTQWERKKKQAEAEIQIQMQLQLEHLETKEREKTRGQNQIVKSVSPSENLVPSARSSMSLNDLMESKTKGNQSGVNSSSSSTSILLTPPPDLRAASFDRCKRFPYFHLLRDRYEEISNCAKSSGLQSGFNRYHFYASRMNDILNYFTNGSGSGSAFGSGENLSCQLSEQLESHKFVSVIKAHYGKTDLNEKNLASCLASDSQHIIAIGYGNTALEATEKAVQLTHDRLFSQKTELEKQDGFPSSSFSNCLIHSNVIKVKMKEKEKEKEDFDHFSLGCGDAPLINID